MSVFVPVENCAQATLLFAQADGEYAENVWGIQRDEAWDTASLATMADAIAHWYGVGDGSGNRYSGFQAIGCSPVEVIMRDLTIQAGQSVTSGAFDAHTHGEIDSTALPNGVTFCVTARTGFSGRSYRGRTYAVGLTTGFVQALDENLAQLDNAAHFAAMMETLIAAVTAADAHSKLSVISRYSGIDPTTKRPIPRLAGLTTPILSYGYHDLFMDYQRRRAPGHNRHR